MKGNATAAILSDEKHFGPSWHGWPVPRQDEIVLKLLKEEDDTALLRWLMHEFQIDESRADRIANATLPEGYGALSKKALDRILPELMHDVITYDKAVIAAGFEHHSMLSHAAQTGEIMEALPYYGEPLQRHVGFGTGDLTDHPEKRFGRIANPTVHIGLNQLRKVVNALIARYGHPSEVIVEVTRELKQSKAQRDEIQKEQATRQKQNTAWKKEIREIVGVEASALDIQKMKLWTELNPKDVTNRRCPYTGEKISLTRLFSEEIEIEHILPFSRTLDDSLNNKTVSLRRANRDKGNRTPHEAFGHSPDGYNYPDILERANSMSLAKRKRFAPDGYERWLKEDKDFLARALTDTAYLSRIAREYLSLVCPPNKVRAIPGRLTFLLRGKFGLNDVLGLSGEKNRNDHRHHAVDACVIGVTDQGLLQRFAKASASAREQRLNKLVDAMPEPFPNYRSHVQRAVAAIIVNHRPDHSHEGPMMDDTAYRAPHADAEGRWRTRGIGGSKPNDRNADAPIIGVYSTHPRHVCGSTETALPYKGYLGGSNYSIEIVRNNKGNWIGEVLTTFQAYQLVKNGGVKDLRNPHYSASKSPLVMRLMNNDYVVLSVDGKKMLMRIVKIGSNGQFFMAEHHEANVDARNNDKQDSFAYISKTAGSLRSANGRRVTVSPIGDVTDPGFTL